MLMRRPSPGRWRGGEIMSNQIISDFKDEFGETVRETVKVVKRQITQKPPDQTAQEDKVDQVTGKPIPKKKTLTDLQKATAQLAQARLKKVREELEKQRLKVSQPARATPIENESPKPKEEDIVQKTLKGSKSTGEFKGLIGG